MKFQFSIKKSNKLNDLQKGLDIDIDLNRIVTMPDEKDLKTLNNIR